MNPRSIIFAGGGTGGHVFPMIAVADAVRELAPELRLVFVGTERGLENRLVPERGYELELLDVAPMRGDGVRGVLRGASRAAASIPSARRVLKKYAPSAVFSIGGYAAGPVSLAARTLGIPVALMEPNCEIGLANKLIARLVQRAYTAFPEAQKHFKSAVVLQTGVPLRAGFRPVPYARTEDVLRVLVFGGSQGAKTLNENVPRALARIKGPISITHQCGPAHEATTRELYAELNLSESVRVIPFIDDVPATIAAADLVIGRAGAGAISEICAVGRPSLLVPYPYAGDHQRYNAFALVNAKAAVCVLSKEASPERIAQEITLLCEDPERLPRMAANARSLGRPEAALTIARDLLELAGVGANTKDFSSKATKLPNPNPGNVAFEGVA
jgi:UDP-N-acetylglucosamine--N-acetylmuramyl-(pentapeptide) pyrophosphoryl-undecaprenol N-acetylglucosamine transferase